MAALEDVAVFGSRINLGAVGLDLTRTLLILIYGVIQRPVFSRNIGDILI